jgi:hypothetical protein
MRDAKSGECIDNRIDDLSERRRDAGAAAKTERMSTLPVVQARVTIVHTQWLGVLRKP